MNLKRTIRRWLLEDEVVQEKMLNPSCEPVETSLDSTGMRFEVFKASGGIVIEVKRYDHVKDKHHLGLYVITNDQDLGNEISKIITIEALKI